MGVNRYSRNNRRWEERFDELQRLCHIDDLSPKMSDLTAHDIKRAYWQCRSVGWRDDGKDQCWHKSEKTPLDLTEINPSLTVKSVRRKLYCSACGRRRPYLQLIAE